MRELETDLDWQINPGQSGEFYLPLQPQIGDSTSGLNGWEYQRLQVAGALLLYARAFCEESETVVLGAFDTAQQADLFVALHQQNPLFVPALKVEFSWPVVDSAPVPYEGVYRVGLKSYRVVKLPDGAVQVEYSEGYKTELVGEAQSDVDACLLVYNHFDARLRGCKLC